MFPIEVLAKYLESGEKVTLVIVDSCTLGTSLISFSFSMLIMAIELSLEDNPTNFLFGETSIDVIPFKSNINDAVFKILTPLELTPSFNRETPSELDSDAATNNVLLLRNLTLESMSFSSKSVFLATNFPSLTDATSKELDVI